MSQYQSSLDSFIWCRTEKAPLADVLSDGTPVLRFAGRLKDYLPAREDADPLALLVRPKEGCGPHPWSWEWDPSDVALDREEYERLRDEQRLHPDTPDPALQARYIQETAFSNKFGPLWLPAKWKPGHDFALPIAELHAAQSAVFEAWSAWENAAAVLLGGEMASMFTNAGGKPMPPEKILEGQRKALEETMARLSAQDRGGRLALTLTGKPASLLSYVWLRLQERARQPIIERACRDRECPNVFDVDLSDGNQRKGYFCPQRNRRGRGKCVMAVRRDPSRDRYPELRKKT